MVTAWSLSWGLSGSWKEEKEEEEEELRWRSGWHSSSGGRWGETRYGTESYCHLASKVPQVFHDDGDDRASNNSIKSPCSWSGAPLVSCLLFVECWFRAKHKMWKPFWSIISVPGVRSSCAFKKEPMRHAQTPNLASAQTWLPQTPGVVYACYTGRIEKRAAREVPTRISWLMVPPTWEMDCSTSDAILFLLPSSSFPRYIAGESGTNVPTFLKLSKSCPMIERSTQDVSFPVFPENSHHFIITLGTHPCGLFHTVMKYCRAWKLEKVRRWYR